MATARIAHRHIYRPAPQMTPSLVPANHESSIQFDHAGGKHAGRANHSRVRRRGPPRARHRADCRRQPAGSVVGPNQSAAGIHPGAHHRADLRRAAGGRTAWRMARRSGVGFVRCGRSLPAVLRRWSIRLVLGCCPPAATSSDSSRLRRSSATYASGDGAVGPGCWRPCCSATRHCTCQACSS